MVDCAKLRRPVASRAGCEGHKKIAGSRAALRYSVAVPREDLEREGRENGKASPPAITGGVRPACMAIYRWERITAVDKHNGQRGERVGGWRC